MGFITDPDEPVRPGDIRLETNRPTVVPTGSTGGRTGGRPIDEEEEKKKSQTVKKTDSTDGAFAEPGTYTPDEPATGSAITYLPPGVVPNDIRIPVNDPLQHALNNPEILDKLRGMSSSPEQIRYLQSIGALPQNAKIIPGQQPGEYYLEGGIEYQDLSFRGKAETARREAKMASLGDQEGAILGAYDAYTKAFEKGNQIQMDALDKLNKYSVGGQINPITGKRRDANYDIGRYLRDHPDQADILLLAGFSQPDIDEAFRQNKADMPTGDYVARYFSDRGWDLQEPKVTASPLSIIPGAKERYQAQTQAREAWAEHMREASTAYIKEHGMGDFIRSGAGEAGSFIVPVARAVQPGVGLKNISGTEWAMTGVQVALTVTPFVAGKVLLKVRGIGLVKGGGKIIQSIKAGTNDTVEALRKTNPEIVSEFKDLSKAQEGYVKAKLQAEKLAETVQTARTRLDRIPEMDTITRAEQIAKIKKLEAQLNRASDAVNKQKTILETRAGAYAEALQGKAQSEAVKDTIQRIEELEDSIRATQKSIANNSDVVQKGQAGARLDALNKQLTQAKVTLTNQIRNPSFQRQAIGFDSPTVQESLNRLPKDIIRHTDEVVDDLLKAQRGTKGQVKQLERALQNAEARLNNAKSRYPTDPSKYSDIAQDVELARARLNSARLGDVNKLEMELARAKEEIPQLRKQIEFLSKNEGKAPSSGLKRTRQKLEAQLKKDIEIVVNHPDQIAGIHKKMNLDLKGKTEDLLGTGKGPGGKLKGKANPKYKAKGPNPNPEGRKVKYGVEDEGMGGGGGTATKTRPKGGIKGGRGGGSALSTRTMTPEQMATELASRSGTLATVNAIGQSIQGTGYNTDLATPTKENEWQAPGTIPGVKPGSQTGTGQAVVPIISKSIANIPEVGPGTGSEAQVQPGSSTQPGTGTKVGTRIEPKPDTQPKPEIQPKPGVRTRTPPVGQFPRKPSNKVMPMETDPGQSETAKQLQEKFKNGVTWKQGVVWWAINEKGEHIATVKPIAGVQQTTAKTAFKTIQAHLGKGIAKMTLDMGIMDIQIRNPKKTPGAVGAIKFKRDPQQRTISQVNLKSHGTPKPSLNATRVGRVIHIKGVGSTRSMPKGRII